MILCLLWKKNYDVDVACNIDLSAYTLLVDWQQSLKSQVAPKRLWLSQPIE